MAKQEFRLFVSSTFRDLQAERDELVKRVFPRIRAECNKRGVTFTEIDLRWGITQQEARTGQVVRICLEEIDRCAPYFIGILGDRYGWIPTRDDLTKDAGTLETYPWLEGFIDDSRSIIDMEFAYGATMRDVAGSAFFYRRRTPDLRTLSTTGDVAPAEEVRLAQLAGLLRKSKLPIRSFHNAESFGKQVYRDLMSIIERDWPATEPPSELGAERTAHQAFARARTRSYVADPRYEKLFDQHIAEEGPQLVFSGRSGLGKSALLAHLALRQQQSDPNCFVISHFVGADQTASAASIIRHIMLEIKDRFQLEDEIPASEDTLRDELPAWLAKVQHEKLIVLIDALDQLSGVDA
ncbi:MAG TPA: DUF4062 domain-containing protein, partial [Candidatus Kapabacteria bacterium]|nr:DUF4062 domain-containing protein [Candidatus Kapabacteria bacterium]